MVELPKRLSQNDLHSSFITIFSYLVKSLGNSLHDPIEVPSEQLQAARVEQQSTLATGLRASGTSRLCMSELLMLTKCRDILCIEPESIVGDRSGSGDGMLGRAVMRRRHGVAAAMLRSLVCMWNRSSRHHHADACIQRASKNGVVAEEVGEEAAIFETYDAARLHE